MGENYSKRLEALISSLGEKTPRLLLHCCCAPCSSYCLEYLSGHFDITLFYYNPNISPENEFKKRAAELLRLSEVFPAKNKIDVVIPEYDPMEFFDAVKGLETIPEGGERCFRCYRLRLLRAAQYAREHEYDYFCSTLSISPWKNAGKLNEIGEELGAEYSVAHLPNDFKKKNGFKRSVELSEQYGLYRQDYCGCVFSKKEAEQRRGVV